MSTKSTLRYGPKHRLYCEPFAGKSMSCSRTKTPVFGMTTYSVTVREREGRLWITIPAAIRRSFGLRAGDTVRWRKQRGENAYIITFFRRGRRILPR